MMDVGFYQNNCVKATTYRYFSDRKKNLTVEAILTSRLLVVNVRQLTLTDRHDLTVNIHRHHHPQCSTRIILTPRVSTASFSLKMSYS